MTVEFTKEEGAKLIEEYYKRLEDRVVKANIRADKGYIGWRDEEGCIITIEIAEVMEIAGMQKEIKETITKDELLVILKALFELYELDINSISYDAGLNHRWEGYGMNEHEEKYVYFNGIEIDVTKRKNFSLKKEI